MALSPLARVRVRNRDGGLWAMITLIQPSKTTAAGDGWGGIAKGKGRGDGVPKGAGVWGPAFSFSWGAARGVLFRPGARPMHRAIGLSAPAIIASRSTRNWRTAEVEEALWSLATGSASEEVQLYAAAALLERWHGKPKAMVIEQFDPLSHLTDAELQAELASKENEEGNAA